MSDNFWDVNLAKQNEQTEELEMPKEKATVTPVVEFDISLSDFPVGNWDSDNDAMHIVQWYNDNRLAVDEKSLDFFKTKSEVKYLSNYSDAQKILDSAIETLQEEGCTVWRPPYYDDDDNGIPLTVVSSIGGLVGGWTFAVVWCAVSFVALFFIGGPAIADLGTSDWTPTDGVIIDSGVDTSTDGEGGTTYCLWVDYQYTFNDRTYGGDVVSYSKDNSCSSWAGEADEKYPPGEEITVYVNPDNPYEAVIENGLSGVDFFVCCILPFPIVGVLLVIGMLRSTFATIVSVVRPDSAQDNAV
ncbi:MAG: DUF3592 domain-containing protein [Candidatus Thermoplasmatota archaeon]|nr:DUF3592 domain-containing protein [Candidatus Thermoplasmatota archaeon]